MQKFTREKLSQYDGKNGRPAYVVYRGKVYDVSSSFLWKDGIHQVFHSAGQDLTNSLAKAPHGSGMLKKFRVVGVLEE